MFYVYILVNNSDNYKNHSYIGFTNNPIRRLRQHNKEIKGGAKATTNKDSEWEFAVLITGFSDKINALSCEWKLKHPVKNYYKIADIIDISGGLETSGLKDISKIEFFLNKVKDET